jgi:hypothetical protein
MSSSAQDPTSRWAAASIEPVSLNPVVLDRELCTTNGLQENFATHITVAQESPGELGTGPQLARMAAAPRQEMRGFW